MALDVSKAIEIIKNASDEDMTAIEKVLKEETVTEKNAKVLEILKRVDPERYRDLLTLVEIEGELPHVKPGDLITSTLINALIDRINALEAGGESVLRLGPLAQGARTRWSRSADRSRPAADCGSMANGCSTRRRKSPVSRCSTA